MNPGRLLDGSATGKSSLKDLKTKQEILKVRFLADLADVTFKCNERTHALLPLSTVSVAVVCLPTYSCCVILPAVVPVT